MGTSVVIRKCYDIIFNQKSRLELVQVRFIDNSVQNSLQLKKSYSVQVYQFLRKYMCFNAKWNQSDSDSAAFLALLCAILKTKQTNKARNNCKSDAEDKLVLPEGKG